MNFNFNDSQCEECNYIWKGDFLGFTIGGVHSSALGIVRTSDNDRYNEDLTPTIQDITTVVPGRDETYYFGSNYNQKIFTIKFAYDHLTDTQIRKLKNILCKKELQELIFDENPYKIYSVKAKEPPTLNYICFDENYNRIYKGEGTVNFIAYFPFAYSRYKYIENYNAKNILEWRGIEDNKNEWLESAGLKSGSEKYKIILPNIVIDGIEQGQGSAEFFRSLDEIKFDVWRSRYAVLLNNSGDVDTPLKFILRSYKVGKEVLGYQIFLREIEVNKMKEVTFSYEDTPIIGYMKIIIPNNGIFRKIDDSDWWCANNDRPIRLIFNSYNKTIIPYYYKPNNIEDEEEPENPESENIYYGSIRNDILVEGDFFDIPPNEKDKIYLLHIDPITKINSNNELGFGAYFQEVEYNYLYY